MLTCLLQGHEYQASVEQLDNINPPANFTSPLCTLKKINSEVFILIFHFHMLN